MQQELRRFAHRAHEKQQADQRRRVPVKAYEMHRLAGEAGRRGEHLVESHGAREIVGEEDPK